jgi:general stress protein YciG
MGSARKDDLQIAKHVKEKFGEDHYRKIGALGGAHKNPKKGFGTHRSLASLAGKKGGDNRRKKT